MQMGDEDVTQFGETHLTATELHLGALSTVEHQHLVTYLDDLRRGTMAKCGKRTSTPQYMHLERIHYDKRLVVNTELIGRIFQLEAVQIHGWFFLPATVLEGLLILFLHATGLIDQGVST